MEIKIDVVIIVALPLERDAVLSVMNDVRDESRKGRRFHIGTIGKYSVALLCLYGMGNVKSATGATTAILEFEPTSILVSGICGGTKRPMSEELKNGDHLLGDILVADQIVDYESAKQSAEEIERRYEVYRSSKHLLDSAKDLKSDWKLNINCPRPEHPTDRAAPDVHYGVFASGQKVVKDPELVQELTSDWAKLIGIEMEGLGVSLSAFESETKPQFLMAKAICDWADPDKDDDWQPYAAAASATFIARVLMSNPFDPKPSVKVEGSSSESIVQFSGVGKTEFCKRLGASWTLLADVLEIPDYETAKFSKGEEARAIWSHLAARQKLGALVEALHSIDRTDLKDLLLDHP